MIAELHDKLPDAGETLDPGHLTQLRDAASALRSAPDAPARARELATTLANLADHEEGEHPEQAARNYLYQRRPVFLWFAEDRRQIESSFSLDEEPSQALQNLLALIEFDIDALRMAVDQADRPRIAELTNEARVAFAELFHGRWRQAHVRAELDVDGRDVHVFVANTAGRLIPIADRSDGLRQFIALLAFVEREAAGREAIVLVDEAEQHLHYDAQADLVRVFSGQIAAKKIIYTTHSAGCLPHDLGSGVRVLEPTGPDDVSPEDWDRSRVQNWFWTKGPGFSPLLMAMGASSFAFAGTRMAVVAEGISDVLLLPTLFREATGRDVIEFQVAPGLANVSERTLAELDFTASRLVYLVDRDAAGKAKRQQLLAAGVDSRRVFMLGSRGTLTLEDLLDKDAYFQAINRELHLRQGRQIPASALPRVGRKKALARWCATQADNLGGVLDPPSERAVAHHLFQLQREASLRGECMRLVDSSRRAMLTRLHDEIMDVLSQTTYRRRAP